MLKRTDEEIKEFFKTIQEYNWRELDIEINREPNKIKIKVSQMYEFVPNGFKELTALGEFFETDKVNGSDKDYYTGCETCDYGSSYTVTFVIEE